MAIAIDNNYYGLSWVASVSLFMQALDATILNTAIPAISESLDESPLEMQLVVISYALTVAILIPISGWVADKYGTLFVFRTAVLIFIAGSFACAFATSLDMLIAFRIIQGIGGALMVPAARLSLIKTIPKEKLLPAWNLMAMSGLVGPIIGPILGGVLVTYISWHWIFLVNIPIGILGIMVSARYMPNIKGIEAHAFDFVGFILLSCGLCVLTIALNSFASSNQKPFFSSALFTLSFFLFIGYYFYAKRQHHALIPLSLFLYRTFRIGVATNILIRLCASGIPFLLPLMLQIVQGKSPQYAGWLMAPIAISSLLTKPFTSKLLARFGYKPTLLVSVFIMSITVACFAVLDEFSPLWLDILINTIYGICISLVFTSINTLAICDLKEPDISSGTTVLSISQQIGVGFSIALASILLSSYRVFFSNSELAVSFKYTFYSCGVIGLLALIGLSYLKAKDGNNMYYHKKG